MYFLKVAKKVDEQWNKIKESAENQPSSSTSSRQGNRTPLASNTHSLNVKNTQTTSQSGTLTPSISSSKAEDKKRRSTGERKLLNDHSASSSERLKPASGPTWHNSAVQTAPVVGTVYTDDTDNDVTTDSDMAHTEVDDKRAAAKDLIDSKTSKRQEVSSRSSRARPASAQDRHKSSRDRTSSKDRYSSREKISRSHDRQRSRDRVSSRVRDVPALPLDRQEPDGRSSRQGRVEDKSDSKRGQVSGEKLTKKESEGRRSGQSLDRGNNTGSSEPPTVIEVIN